MEELRAYNCLVQALTNLKGLVESIEIIPNAPENETQYSEPNPYHPLLFMDGNLGIPQWILFKAYIIASQQFPLVTSLDPSSGQPNELVKLVLMTAILLIANPAHNTALNRRKQLIKLYPTILSPDEDIKFMASLMGNKESSKSSLLWHHRRWTYHHMYNKPYSPTKPTRNDSGDPWTDTPIPIEVLTSEFELVSRASEVYPRNYFAWLHRYLCAQCLISQVKGDVPRALPALLLELENTRRWVELHAADYTAAHYLSHIVSVSQELGIPASFHSPPVLSDPIYALTSSTPTANKFSMLSHALSLVASYPVHESLWLYLRLSCTASLSTLPGLDEWIIDLNRELSGSEDESSEKVPALPLSSHALVQKIYSACRKEDLPTIRKHALHFLVWNLLWRKKQLQIDENIILRVSDDLEYAVKYFIGQCDVL